MQNDTSFKDVLASEETIQNLEDDIDKPMKLIVGAAALIGAKPQWSCCGFNYDGQPAHKDHVYGL
jgi:hypothetical protein